MNNSLLEGTMWWTTQALAFSAHWHWRLWREIDIITRHNQTDNIMQHLQLIFTFQSLERLLCHNSLESKRNLARQLLWFSLQPGHVKKVRKLFQNNPDSFTSHASDPTFFHSINLQPGFSGTARSSKQPRLFHRTTDWFGLGRTLKTLQSQPPAKGRDATPQGCVSTPPGLSLLLRL